MARKKSKRRRRRKKPEKLDRLRRKLKQGPFKDFDLVPTTDDTEKMSVVLGRYVKPLVKYTDSEESYRKLITLAVIAWNASCCPEKERQSMIAGVFEEGFPAIDPELKSGLRELVDQLVARKLAYFSKYRRLIIDFEVVDLGDQYYLSVASTPDSDSDMK